MKRIIAGMVMAASVALWAGMAGATDYTWTGLAGTAWTNGGNWSGGIGTDYPDGADDTALINSGGASTSITNSGNLMLGELTLDTGFSGTNTLGGSLTLSTAGGKSGNLTVNGGKLQTVRNAVGGISVAGAMTIGTGGVVIVRRSSTSGEGAGQTITAQNLVVEGALKADGQGFSGATKGPGFSLAASHGGRGVSSFNGYSGLSSGPTYGSVSNPIALGSACGANEPGEAGGGAIVLVVANALTNNGLISANGQGYNNTGSAGGSVNITAATLAGTGVVQVIGGANGVGNGGGGRIAVVLTNQTDFGSVQFKAFGASSAGSAGTVYRKHKDHAGLGELIINNNGVDPEYRGCYTGLSTDGDVVQNFARVVITNNGNLAIGTNDTLNFNTATNIVGYGPTKSAVTLLSIAGVTFPNPFTLTNTYALRIDVPVNASGSDWTVPAGAVLSHSGNYDVDTNRLQLALRNLTIENNGAINADAKGFATDKGPGKATSSTNGASHGGAGTGTTLTNSMGMATNTYGSVTNPITLGSGGYQYWNTSGGGAVILTIANALTNNGLISANGGASADRAGSGGSINILAATVSGSGMVLANGAGRSTDGRGAGGGRIAVRLASGTSFGSMTFQAYSGPTNASPFYPGAAGTVYLESANDGAGMGTVTVANSNRTASGSAVTPLPAFPGATENLSKTKWTVDYKGKIGLVSNVTIGALTLVTTNAYLELAGKTLTVNSLSITGRQFAANTDGYTAAQLGTNNVTDVSPGAVGRVVVLARQSGTLLLVK